MLPLGYKSLALVLVPMQEAVRPEFPLVRWELRGTTSNSFAGVTSTRVRIIREIDGLTCQEVTRGDPKAACLRRRVAATKRGVAIQFKRD